MLTPPPDPEGYLPGSLFPCLALLAMTQFSEQPCPLISFPPPDVHVPSTVYCHITLPKVFTHLQWMLWQMSMVKSITSS